MALLVVVLLLGGAAVAWQRWQGGDTQAVDAPATPNRTSTTVATQHSTQPTAAPPTAGRSRSSPTPSESDDQKAEQLLDACRAKVEAADKTLAAAKVGIGHWSEHVQAQTDFNTGKIDADRLAKIFKRTRNAGPSDVRKYNKAVKAYNTLPDSRDVLAAAPAKLSSAMARCDERSRAQDPVLSAAEDGMHDWAKHLSDMRRSDSGQVHDARGIWIRTWSAAPPHIRAFDRAVARFEAPDC
ncbi:MAG: hypothetical protein H0T91_01370 [Propionibacteriaceae bacterium]|nr:hypothetical protein [Propionibacteriaceae bacterium]